MFVLGAVMPYVGVCGPRDEADVGGVDGEAKPPFYPDL